MPKKVFPNGQHGYDGFYCDACDVEFFDEPEFEITTCPHCGSDVPNDGLPE